MTLTTKTPQVLPFTTACLSTGNFPGEYSETLRWRCNLYDGHEGNCVPREFDQRLYNRRLDIRRYHLEPGEFHLNDEMLRHVVSIAIRDCDDSGVMWLRIRHYIAFANFLRMVCP